MKLPLRNIVLRFLPGERITQSAILARYLWHALHQDGARVVVGQS
jgi:hypothetical protein